MVVDKRAVDTVQADKWAAETVVDRVGAGSHGNTQVRFPEYSHLDSDS